MLVGVLKEDDGAPLVALAPANVPKLAELGHGVVVETGAGARAGYPDAAYEQAGARVAPADQVWGAEAVVAVKPPRGAVTRLQNGQHLIAQIHPQQNEALVGELAQTGGSVLALDAVPRISRAQSLDVLSSISNLAGYRAVIEAANEYQGMFGGQVTAAGRTPPAKVFVIGAGVAGLAAIGTAVALGAEVHAFDVRPEAAEQIESMGATAVTARDAQQQVSTDGYAAELTDAQQAATEALYAEQTAWADVVITTALVRGAAPVLLPAAMVEAMRPGSVIVDLAASGGGNAEPTVPGERVVTPGGVVVLGYEDLAARMPAQASQLFGTNVTNLLGLLTPESDGRLVLNLEDPVQRGMTVAHGGEVLWPPPPVAVAASPAAASGSSSTTTTTAQPVAATLPTETAGGPAASPAVKAQRAMIGLALVAVLLLLLLTFTPAVMLNNFTILALSIVVGFYVISDVAPALHTPLMAHTNAISGIVMVGALLMLNSPSLVITIIAAVAAIVAGINVFGGFLVTQRMVAMFRSNFSRN